MRLRNDEGSILLLGLGLAVMVFSLVAVMADIAVLRLARHELNSQADAAALAGAQAIDIDALVDAGYLEQGPAHLVPLDAKAAVAAVRTHLRSMNRPEVSVVAIEANESTVSVRLAVAVRPPFIGTVRDMLGQEGVVVVRATAAAQTRVG